MKMILLIAGAVVLLVVAFAFRNSMQSKHKIQQDTYVLVTSHLGNSLVVPSQWTQTDKGDTFTLKSPDGQAIIHAIMFTAEGSGTLTEFGDLVASSLLPKDASKWQESKWITLELAGTVAKKRELSPIPESHQQWRIYTFDGGKFYHVVILNASNLAMALNGNVYENIVRTFKGVREQAETLVYAF